MEELFAEKLIGPPVDPAETLSGKVKTLRRLMIAAVDVEGFGVAAPAPKPSFWQSILNFFKSLFGG